MTILVTGGAGYIGGFMTQRLLDDGHTVITIDNLSRGNKVYSDSRTEFIQGDLLDKSFLDTLFSEFSFDAIIHFGGVIAVGESVKEPYLYFNTNVTGSLNLIETATSHNVKHIIFSSTAGVYGIPTRVPIKEDDPKTPESPYGESKLMVEKLLAWYQKTKGLNYVVLRYFNACGAALDGSRGEDHIPESHLIPCVLQAAMTKQPFTLFGDDYNTPDGSCVRDYIHVLDLVDAHVKALEKIMKDGGSYTYNLGTGKGYSNKEIVAKAKEVTSIDFQVEIKERRAGDPDSLIADVSKIKEELDFEPRYSDIDTILSSAWLWHQKKS